MSNDTNATNATNATSATSTTAEEVAKMKAEMERLRAENTALKNQERAVKSLSLKVSEKGALSVYGLGRFPVTLYKEQWARLLDITDDIRAFIKDNDARLKTKEKAEKDEKADKSEKSEKPAKSDATA